jgi:hypothetical protein
MNARLIFCMIIVLVGVGLFIALAREFVRERRESQTARERRRWLAVNRDETSAEIAALLAASERGRLVRGVEPTRSGATNEAGSIVGAGPVKPEPWKAPELRVKP